MEVIAVNVAGNTRRETWQGREYVVVPMTLLVPGVLQGSKGPLLYPADEVRKSPDDWNHIPIVVYHPMKDGKPVSARSPSILSKYGVGFVFHSRTDSKGVLKGEGWLDVEATRRVDRSVLDSVQLGKPIELSTGLFVDDEPAPEGAIFNDHRGSRKYVGIARNYKPDHLAILPSGKGACSLADGCGVLINEAAMEAYQVIVNELEAEAVSLYFPDFELDILTANKFNPSQPRDKAGRFATVGQATKAVEKAQGRVSKAQAALEKAKATLKVEKSGLLTAKKGLSEAKAREKAKSPAATKAIGKAKASAGTVPRGRTAKTTTAPGLKPAAASKPATPATPRPAASPRAGKSAAGTHLTNPKGSTFGAHDPQGPIHLDGSPLRFGDLVHIHEPGGQPRLAAVAHAHRDVAADPTGVSSGTRVTIRPSAKYASTFGRTSSEVSMGFVRRATSEDVKAWSASSGKPVPHEVIKDFPALATKTGGGKGKAGKSGKSSKSVDEHHAETEALSQRGVAGKETWTPAGATFKAAESHDSFNKAVDSHFANLNKSLNKAQVHELADRMGFSQTKSTSKKAVLDKLKKAIHDRRDTKHRTYA